MAEVKSLLDPMCPHGRMNEGTKECHIGPGKQGRYALRMIHRTIIICFACVEQRLCTKSALRRGAFVCCQFYSEGWLIHAFPDLIFLLKEMRISFFADSRANIRALN